MPKPRPTIPAELPLESITALIDTREQYPLDLAPLRAEQATLATGDYSAVGLESIVALERKSLSDLLSCIGQERERFEREVQRLLAYPVRGLVVESTWGAIETGDWRGKVTTAAAMGSLLGWAAAGLPIFMVGTHDRAGRFVARLITLAARQRWREARALLGAAEDEPATRSRSAYPPESVAAFDATAPEVTA